jgi:2,3-bisphosphoglycerate-dependent phosphoglycerate mutase
LTKLILLRHGQSLWNRDKRFTGWTDIGLSEQGKAEAVRAGELLRADGVELDACFTSCLSRSSETLRIVLETMGRTDVPVQRSWRLNERHYGALQGLSLWQAVRRFGPLLVFGCQRRYAIAPPPLQSPPFEIPRHDPGYAGMPIDAVPRGESLRDTLFRVLPLWQEAIEPELRRGKCILVVSHRNTLRALVKHLENVSDADAAKVKVPTGRPLVYELDDRLRPIRRYALKSLPAGADRTVASERAL